MALTISRDHRISRRGQFGSLYGYIGCQGTVHLDERGEIDITG